MTEVRELLADQGVTLKSYAVGEHKGLCPQCSC